jgi:hypothetical protein
MSVKKIYLSPIIIFLLIIINFPKFNLITIGGLAGGDGNYPQGIRLDDVLIFIFVLLNLNKILLSRDSILIFFYITFVYLLSFFHQINSIHFFYVQFHYIKFLEYFLLYSILVRTINADVIIKVAIYSFIIQLIYGTYVFYTTPYQAEFTIASRAKGTTAGPWELVNMIVIFYFILADHYYKKKNIIKIFIFYSLTWYVILISYSRMAAIAFIVLLLIKKIKYSILIFTAVIFIFLVSINLNFFQYIEIGYFSLNKTFNFLKDFTIPILNNFSQGDFFLGRGGGFYDRTFQNYDPSIVGRLQQWGRYLTTFNNSEFKYIAYIFGNGPGSGGIINDGMYIKLFVDFGLVGFLIYLYLIIKYFLSNKRIRNIIIFISISSVTLDFYWPTKIAYSLILLIIYFKNEGLKVKQENKASYAK